MQRPPLELILEFAGDRAAGCVSSDSNHRIYAPGSAHGVTCGSFLMWVLSCCFVWDTSPAILVAMEIILDGAQTACWRCVSMLRGPKKRDGGKM